MIFADKAEPCLNPGYPASSIQHPVKIQQSTNLKLLTIKKKQQNPFSICFSFLKSLFIGILTLRVNQ